MTKRRNADPSFFARLLQTLRQTAVKPRLGPNQASLPFDPEIRDQLLSNERIWSGFRTLELRMLSAATLREVIDVVTEILPAQFPSVSVATLAWFDPDYEVSRLVEHETGQASRRFVFMHAPAVETALPKHRPLLGPMDQEIRRLLFPKEGTALHSMAIAPLRLRGHWVGSLNQASDDPRHFTPDAATDLLEHLAAVTALCVDNALNRVRLQRDGLTDPLTLIANRRFFERRLHEEINLWLRRGHALSCLLVDVDHFKQINDRYGHPVGDQALKKIARALSVGLRKSDVLARYGGEEFALLLPESDIATAREIAERLRVAVGALRIDTPQKSAVGISVSIGLAALSAEHRSALEDPGMQLLRWADQALYTAKKQGRNRVEFLNHVAEKSDVSRKKD